MLIGKVLNSSKTFVCMGVSNSTPKVIETDLTLLLYCYSAM
jgi:hypothetical protein